MRKLKNQKETGLYSILSSMEKRNKPFSPHGDYNLKGTELNRITWFFLNPSSVRGYYTFSKEKLKLRGFSSIDELAEAGAPFFSQRDLDSFIYWRLEDNGFIKEIQKIHKYHDAVNKNRHEDLI